MKSMPATASFSFTTALFPSVEITTKKQVSPIVIKINEIKKVKYFINQI